MRKAEEYGPVRSAIRPSFIVAAAARVEPPDPAEPDGPDALLHAEAPVTSSAAAATAIWVRLIPRKVRLVFMNTSSDISE